jgi:hypothetical protein
MARILPFSTENTVSRTPGIDKGKVTIKPDFDEALPLVTIDDEIRRYDLETIW